MVTETINEFLCDNKNNEISKRWSKTVALLVCKCLITVKYKLYHTSDYP